MEVLSTLSIGDGSVTPQKIYLEVDSNKICYVVQPSGAVLTSTAGVIDTTWGGSAGKVVLVIPKTTTIVTTDKTGSYSSDFTGDFSCNLNAIYLSSGSSFSSYTTPNATIQVNFGASSSLTDFYAPKIATNIFASGCALTAKSIGDFLISASINNPTASATANFGLGTNANRDAINAYLITRGTTLAAIELIIDPTWTLTFNA